MISTKILHQTLALIPVALIQFIIGIGLGWLAPTINQFKIGKSEFPINEEQCSWIASVHHVTRATAPFLSAAIIDRVGRSIIFVAVACIILAAWIITLMTRHVLGLYVARLAEGLAAGIFDASVSTYIGENFSPRVRGVFTGVTCVIFFAGTLLAYVLADYLSYTSIAGMYAALAFIAVVSTTWLTETPQFLIMKGDESKARRNFCWLRNAEYEDVKTEFEEMKQYVLEEEGRNSFTALFHSSEVRRNVRAVIIILFLSMATGYPAVSAFVTVAFAKSAHLTSNKFTILLGLVQLITCCASTLFLDKVDRRTLLMLACVASALTQAGTAVLYHVHYVSTVPYFHWLLLVTLSSYSSVYGMLFRPLTSVIRGEMLPQSAKAYGSSLSIVATSISGFTLSFAFLPVSKRYGIEANFVIYFVVSCLLLVYVFFELPETRGMTLVDIQRTIGGYMKNDGQKLPKSTG